MVVVVGWIVYLNLFGELIINKIYCVIECCFCLDGGVMLMCIEDGLGLWGDNLIFGM